MTQDQGQVPQRVVAGRYAVVSEIGRGGMGIVWLAEDRMIGRRVAIKELHLPDGIPPDERDVFEQRVLREARTAGRLNDPAVVTVFDVLQEAGGTFIVMELIEAPTLSDLVRRQGPLSQNAVTRLAEQVLSALESAHAAGIVHRDVKPSNIMVLPNGRAKLTDFGIAQSLEDPRLTTSGVLVGSPTYMAPERIRGADADAGSDLWSLGATLFFAVEGHAPFERSTTAATMHAIMNEVPFLTRCQGPLASVIMGLLISTPEARLIAPQVRGLLAQASPHHEATAPVPTQALTDTRYLGAPGAQPSRTKRRALMITVAAVVAVALIAVGWLIGSNLGDDANPGANPVSGTSQTSAPSGPTSPSSDPGTPTSGPNTGSASPSPSPGRDPELVAIDELMTRYVNAVNIRDEDAIKKTTCDGGLGQLYPRVDDGTQINATGGTKLANGTKATTQVSASVDGKYLTYTTILEKTDRWCIAS